MEPETTNVQAQEASNAAPIIEVPKRDTANGSGAADMEEPPAKKARLDEPSKPAQVDMRDRGIAPIKAEYVRFTSNDRKILTLVIQVSHSNYTEASPCRGD